MTKKNASESFIMTKRMFGFLQEKILPYLLSKESEYAREEGSNRTADDGELAGQLTPIWERESLRKRIRELNDLQNKVITFDPIDHGKHQKIATVGAGVILKITKNGKSEKRFCYVSGSPLPVLGSLLKMAAPQDPIQVITPDSDLYKQIHNQPVGTEISGNATIKLLEIVPREEIENRIITVITNMIEGADKKELISASATTC